MIRFIDIGNQISNDEHRDFAWFDTVTDSFFVYCGEQRWETWDEFESAHSHDGPNESRYPPIERFKQLYPKDRP